MWVQTKWRKIAIGNKCKREWDESLWVQRKQENDLKKKVCYFGKQTNNVWQRK